MRRYILLLLLALPVLAAGTSVLFDPSTPSTGPFPTDFLTVMDATQKTGLSVSLPFPDCNTQPTTCRELTLINQLDGFNLRARATIQFSGPVDVTTLKGGIFFVALENLTPDEVGIHKPGDVITTNQLVFDSATNTLYAKPDSVLDQHRRYAIVVTDAVKDTAGDPVGLDPNFVLCLQGTTPYCAALVQKLMTAVVPGNIVAASYFTTMSATAWLESARPVLDSVPPNVTLLQPQSSFHIPDIATVVLHQQVGVNPPRFYDLTLPLNPVLLAGLDRLVIGSFTSPNFLQADQSIAPGPTLQQLQAPASTNQVYFNALLPASPKPANGYPVVIFGHGFGDSRFGGPTAVASKMASAGFAVIAINAVGHGFGPASTVSFIDNSGNTTTLTAGGRGVDVNGDSMITSEEGCDLVTPITYGLRDCFRQTVVDLMQLTSAIRQGIDLDGDGTPDLDAGQIYYAGESLGGMYGTIFTSLEPSVRAATLNVGGASAVDIVEWSPAYTDVATQSLSYRVPSLLNQGSGFNVDYVLPDQPVKITTVPGAIPIQDAFERFEWFGMQGDPMAFAAHLERSPLAATLPPRPVLVQMARADRTMPNPATTGLINAAGLQSSTWLYRHDLARAQAPELPLDPHPFLALFISLGGGTIQLPSINGLSISLDAQQQIAGFFASDGASIPDPNVLSRILLGISVFEMPAVLPADLGF